MEDNSMKKSKILLVEDDETIREMVGEFLEVEGHKVMSTAKGDTAIALLDLHDFDLVFTDLNMRGTDGYEVLKMAKLKNPAPGVIVHSGETNFSEIIKVFRLGADDFVAKPSSLNDVQESIRRHLQRPINGKRAAAADDACAPSTGTTVTGILTALFHDIRSPLLTMAITLNLLAKGKYRSMPNSLIVIMKGLAFKCQKQLDIVDEYLDPDFLARNGRNELHREELDLIKDVFDPVLDELRPDIRKKGIVVDNRTAKRLSGRRLAIRANKVWMKTVFRNLFGNAVKHGSRGCTIGIDSWEYDDYIQCNVFNSGPGVAEHDRHRLFKKNKHISGNDRQDGMGIGLHLASEVVRRHGGTIRYKNVNDTNQFIVTLPQAKRLSWHRA